MDSADRADEFIATNRNTGTPVEMFSRFSGPDGDELDGGYDRKAVLNSPAYRLTCKCGKHMWFKGVREPNVTYGFSLCEDCNDDDEVGGNDRNHYDGSLHMEREY